MLLPTIAAMLPRKSLADREFGLFSSESDFLIAFRHPQVAMRLFRTV
jgi:hypothetical protein